MQLKQCDVKLLSACISLSQLLSIAGSRILLNLTDKTLTHNAHLKKLYSKLSNTPLTKIPTIDKYVGLHARETILAYDFCFSV